MSVFHESKQESRAFENPSTSRVRVIYGPKQGRRWEAGIMSNETTSLDWSEIDIEMENRRSFWLVMLRWILIATLLFTAYAARATVEVYHSPNDDGQMPIGGVPNLLEGSTELHLYVNGGNLPSEGTACEEGDGDEICAWLVDLEAIGSIELLSFTPSGNVTASEQGYAISGLGSDVAGALGPVKIGDLVIDATGDGALELVAGQVVHADLQLENLARRDIVVIAVPEPAEWMMLVSGMGLLSMLRNRRGRS
jgi:hypothetical protein